MKKLILMAILASNSILALGNYLDTPEYQYLKPFLKEEQQIIFNKLIKDSQFSIETLDGKIEIAKDIKERSELERKKEALLKDREKLVENLNMNILKYPERYTESATKLKEEIKKLVLSHSEVK